MRQQAQMMEALARANVVRSEVAALKRELAGLGHVGGCVRAAELLEAEDQRVMRMRVRWLITSIPQIGDTRAGGYYSAAQIKSADRRVGELSPRQRGVLAGALKWRAAEMRA